MKATLVVFHENILLEPIAAASSSSGGIIIPEAFKQIVNQGRVIDKGPQASDNIVMGDILFYPPHSEAKLDYKGNKYIVVAESACLGAIREVKDK
jgi:co-chaperonin GroES (HSP10)